MKQGYIEQLQCDLIKYCDQIGILPEERPTLIINRKEYHALKVSNGESKRSGGYGECHHELRTVFVDCSKRSYHRRIYRKTRTNAPRAPNYGKEGYIYKLHRYGATEYKKVKATYKDKLHVMIHELTHYRFKYMGHGAKFEARINEIFDGKTFSVKQLYHQ